MRKAIFEIVLAVARVLLISIASALAMAVVLDVLEWMRNFGESVNVIPQLSNVQIANRSTGATPTSLFISSVEAWINWYNLTFLGAARFGTALGLVIGGFYALGTLKKSGFAAKVVAGLVVGALIGGRVALLVTSNATFFLFGAITGSLIVGISIGVINTIPQRPSLPDINEL